MIWFKHILNKPVKATLFFAINDAILLIHLQLKKYVHIMAFFLCNKYKMIFASGAGTFYWMASIATHSVANIIYVVLDITTAKCTRNSMGYVMAFLIAKLVKNIEFSKIRNLRRMLFEKVLPCLLLLYSTLISVKHKYMFFMYKRLLVTFFSLSIVMTILQVIRVFPHLEFPTCTSYCNFCVRSPPLCTLGFQWCRSQC